MPSDDYTGSSGQPADERKDSGSDGDERKSFDGGERKHADGLLGEVRGALMSPAFVGEFETFAEQHIATFLRALEDGASPITDGGDHDHSFFDTYRLYLSHFVSGSAPRARRAPRARHV